MAGFGSIRHNLFRRQGAQRTAIANRKARNNSNVPELWASAAVFLHIFLGEAR